MAKSAKHWPVFYDEEELSLMALKASLVVREARKLFCVHFYADFG